MENLIPVEIKLDIFSRLPGESVIECRLVCKTWRNLLGNPYFAHMHLPRQLLNFDHDLNYQNQHNFNGSAATKLGLLLFIGFQEENGFRLYYLGYDENDDQAYKGIKRINHPFVLEAGYYSDVIGSCNGLICISLTHQCAFHDPIHIFNPIPRVYVNLPRFETEVENMVDMRLILRVRMLCGFGYDPSCNEYKVVRIYYPRDEPIAYVQVYTLGSGSGWRNKSKITYSLRRSSGVLANGALHWLDEEGKIVAFNLADEEFHLLPSLPVIGTISGHYELRVLGGWLCVISREIFRGGNTSLWSFKKKDSSYVLKEQGYQSWYWNEEFSVAVQGLYSLYRTFAITKKGEVLFWENDTTLFRFDPKTAATEKLGKLDMHISFNKTITHVNSFVSLQALGEENVKIVGQLKE